jgi:hypothetical protein
MPGPGRFSPKQDRMQQHVYESCMHKYKDKTRCSDMSYAVVNKYKQKHKRNTKGELVRVYENTTPPSCGCGGKKN